MNTGEGFQVLLKNTSYRSNERLAAQRERKMYQRSKIHSMLALLFHLIISRNFTAF